MLERVDIIVPTFNNPQYLHQMVQSVIMHRALYPMRLIIVNNGHPGVTDAMPKLDCLKVVQADGNLGWEGGLALGLKHSDAKFVMFANDDIFVPQGSSGWLRELMHFFHDKKVGAVGPTSNCVMGSQAIWSTLPDAMYFTTFIIGFCMLLRREALDAAGGVHEGLPGGDDIDLSIRLRKAGYALVCARNTFVFHHGFKTGERVHGNSSVVGGWNSQQMTERVNNALIAKHGFRTWYETLFYKQGDYTSVPGNDTEGVLIRSLIKDGNVLELGCGATKTVPHAVGVDMYGAGEMIPTLDRPSVADYKGDVENLPHLDGQRFDNIISRHILEHCVDPIETLRQWAYFLKPGGQLIIAVPNEDKIDSIPMNPEHKHTFTMEFLRKCFISAGLVPLGTSDPDNGVSFVMTAATPIGARMVACS